MADLSLAPILLVAIAYGGVAALASGLWIRRQILRMRGPAVQTRHFWILPSRWIRNALLVVLVPPGLLLGAWLIARMRG